MDGYYLPHPPHLPKCLQEMETAVKPQQHNFSRHVAATYGRKSVHAFHDSWSVLTQILRLFRRLRRVTFINGASTCASRGRRLKLCTDFAQLINVTDQILEEDPQVIKLVSTSGNVSRHIWNEHTWFCWASCLFSLIVTVIKCSFSLMMASLSAITKKASLSSAWILKIHTKDKLDSM